MTLLTRVQLKSIDGEALAGEDTPAEDRLQWCWRLSPTRRCPGSTRQPSYRREPRLSCASDVNTLFRRTLQSIHHRAYASSSSDLRERQRRNKRWLKEVIVCGVMHMKGQTVSYGQRRMRSRRRAHPDGWEAAVHIPLVYLRCRPILNVGHNPTWFAREHQLPSRRCAVWTRLEYGYGRVNVDSSVSINASGMGKLAILLNIISRGKRKCQTVKASQNQAGLLSSIQHSTIDVFSRLDIPRHVRGPLAFARMKLPYTASRFRVGLLNTTQPRKKDPMVSSSSSDHKAWYHGSASASGDSSSSRGSGDSLF